jgi:hypothetical protein
LPAIIPQKRTIELTNQRSHSKQENIREIAKSAKESPQTAEPPERPARTKTPQKGAQKRAKWAR